ncbi:MAG: signal peptidase I [Rhodospirillaceae bacterium]|nr:signal peptidase I [Rhodospirillaceae bacterium]
MNRTASFLWHEGKGVVLALALVLVVRTVAAEPYSVPTPSMVPTLMVGDTLVATKYAYGYSRYSMPIGEIPITGRVLDRMPERGDVIVFRLPRDPSVTYVKRVIGLPGDRIQMKEGRLYINGAMAARREAGTLDTVVLGRPVTLHRYIETLPATGNQAGRDHDILEMSDDDALDNTREYTVPAGQYFMMGDNRDDSLDSRVAAAEGGVGMVSKEYLVGRADLVLYSRDPDTAWWNPASWGEIAKHLRLFTQIS